MSIKLKANINHPPMGGLIVAEIIKKYVDVQIEWTSETSITFRNNTTSVCNSSNDILRALAREAPKYELYGKSPVERTQIDHWLTVSLTFQQNVQSNMDYLQKCLASVTYLVSNKVTIADFAVFKEIFGLVRSKTITLPNHIQRWFNLVKVIPEVDIVIGNIPDALTVPILAEKLSERKQEGKFVDLPGAEMGKVIVRFPPEASGYLHIGHAKAALLNQYYQQAFNGKLIMRFDDTNPAKETLEFEKVILEDLEMLEIKPDLFTHTSDYFDLMLDYCRKLIEDAKAYVDDTEPELMKKEREQRLESVNRSNSVEKNIQLWKEMLTGTETGQKCCVRAKIDMSSPNGCLRDPTIYRCKNEPHIKTGTKYKVYPTYDFACPIVDAIENVTHTLRTMEYHDRDDQFYWFIEALNLRRPYIWEYSRLNMTNTVLSKRKLTWFVEEGLVDGWDDPRFPTVRGILRRGMTVQGLKEFIIAQGSSKSVVFMEWDKIWAFNKKVIDPIVPRYTAVDKNNVVVNVAGASNEFSLVPAHPKNASVGMKKVWFGPRILIDYVDAEILKEGEMATFINWGNLMIDKIDKKDGRITSIDASLRLDNKDFKKTVKLTWLSETVDEFTPTYCVYFEHIISKPVLGRDEDFKNFIGHETRREVQMIGDPDLKKCKKGDIIQLQRRGFFKVDSVYAPPSMYTGVTAPVILLEVPDGKEKPSAQIVTPSSKSQSSDSPKINEKTKKASKQSAPALTSANTVSSLDACAINTKIVSQGEKIRVLKTQKVDKTAIDAEVKLLLSLKGDYKSATGQDWKPGCVESTVGAPLPDNSSSWDLNEKVKLQGDLVRDLKAKKANKAEIDTAVKSLLSLKAEYKTATGTDWKPELARAAPSPSISNQSNANSNSSELNEKIKLQGDLVRDLKTKKANKAEIDTAVKTLLSLKGDFKTAMGIDWKPELATSPASSVSNQSNANSNSSELNEKIKLQGDLVRDLKAKKANKAEIDTAVKTLLSLKGEYKTATGTDWKPELATTSPAPSVSNQSNANSNSSELNEKIKLQGDLVRDLKAKKANKAEIDTAVKTLLSLKGEYKTAMGIDWKPELATSPAPSVSNQSNAKSNSSELNEKIKLQGDLVRDLKAKKANKAEIDTAVKTLLSLKGEYKTATGTDWKPELATTSPAPSVSNQSNANSNSSELNEKIKLQGDLVRDLKAKKANKAEIDTAVKTLLSLKGEYKTATGTDWKPELATTSPAPSVSNQSNANSNSSELNEKIKLQGDLVRDLKAKKANKAEIDTAVKTLLSLKGEYKTATGTDWKPELATTSPAPSVSNQSNANSNSSELNEKIKLQGDLVRDLKAKKANKAEIDTAVKTLLSLKGEYKTATGIDWKPELATSSPAISNKNSKSKEKKEVTKAKIVHKPTAETKEDGSGSKKQTRLGLEAKKHENLPEWYTQILTKGEMIEYYDISGCYILRPWSMSIWNVIKSWFTVEISKLGVKECYFPMFVSRSALEKEKAHIADFSPEVAWVTKSGDTDLAEPIAIRPTSETIMYPAYAKWIQSYRDLPLKLNQWTNIVRWEFKHPQPFLRTREFLWQEGHTAYAKKAEAEVEVLAILDLYARIYEELLAIPVRRGRKTEKEKFAGGDYTTTVEAFISASGRSIQGATSHHLGQNFSKMFDIIYEDPTTQEKNFVYQNSWGLTTRTIGVMIMVHGDDKGLVLPPRVASVQAIIVPCGITANSTDEDREVLQKSCTELESTLNSAGIRAEGDYRDNYSPGWKFNHWELKGVPIRIELGPKDMKANQLVIVRRDTNEKLSVQRIDAVKNVLNVLEEIQKNLFCKAKEDFDNHSVLTKDWKEFCKQLDKKNVLLAPFCGEIACETIIKDQSAVAECEAEVGQLIMGAKSLCIPFDQPAEILPSDKCINPGCTKKPLNYVLFGRSY